MGTHILEPAAQELTDTTATPLPVRAEHRPDNQFAPYFGSAEINELILARRKAGQP
jgi:hypothetical protein